MKIAILTPGGVDRSGVDRVIPCLVWLVERLARTHEVHVVAYAQEPEPASWPLVGATVHNIGTARGARRRLASTFAALHRESPFDVIYGFFGWQGLDAARLGRRWRVPAIVHAAGGEFVAMRGIGYGMRTSLRGRLAMRMAVAGARRIVVSTRFMLAQAAAHGVAADVISLGVALDRWPLRPPRPRDGGGPARLLHVGDVRPVKGQHILLDAAALLRTRGIAFELDVVGHDTTHGAMQRRATELGLGDVVRWHGVLRREPLRALFDRADLHVLPSLHDAAPVVVLEAAIAGVPTVGSDVGYVADWSPSAAVATPVGDANALAAAIAALLADDARRLRVAADAQRRAVAIDADHTAARLCDLFSEVAHLPPGRAAMPALAEVAQ